MIAAFRSLRVRNYRLFAGGQVVSITGSWMQLTAQDWLVLELSHSSGSALGIVTGLQFMPVLFFGLYGGVIADRYDKRRMLVCTQIGMGILALILGILDVTGTVELWHVYALAVGLGAATSIDTPVRQAFVQEMVGPKDLPNAVGLNSSTFSVARVMGPAIAGVLITSIGTGPVFLLNAASFVAVIAGLLAMREQELFRGTRIARAKGQLRDGLAHVRGHPALVVPIVLTALIGMFGLNFQVTIALMAKVTFDRDAGAYGLLGSCLAAGSLLGAFGAAWRSGRDVGPRQRTYVGAAFLFGVCEVAAGLMPTYGWFAASLVPTGFFVLTFTTAVNTSLQLTAGPEFRGRVMSLYLLVLLGGTAIGAPIVGVMAEHFGARSSLWIGGIVSALSAAGCALLLRRRRTAAPGRVRPRRLRVHPEEVLVREALPADTLASPE